MPNQDQTGPFGTGAIGRGRGGCPQSENAPEAQFGKGPCCRGRGRHGVGRGRGKGLCCGGQGQGRAVLSREEEIALLEKQRARLDAQLDALRVMPSPSTSKA